MNSKTFILEETSTWETIDKGVRRQILGFDKSLMIVKVEFEQGSIGALHSHVHSQSTYVASGVFEFIVGNEKQIVKTGNGIYIAPNIEHGVICLESGTLIDAFSPAREDFLSL